MYAFQYYLKKNGYEPFLIKYIPESKINVCWYEIVKKLFNPFHVVRSLNLRRKNIIKARENLLHPRFFNDFREKYIQQTKLYVSIDQLKENPPVADVYITGSDIVWSAPRLAFFLDFGGSSIKKMAYAASFGRDRVSAEMLNFMRPLISDFSFIGVRESVGIDICKQMGRNDAVHVFDPTLLLSKKDYYSILKSPKIDDKFCLLYLTGADTFFSMSKINKILKNNKIKLFYTTCDRYDRYAKIYPSIEEWLGYCDEAEVIITNSFHGCIFSILFEKKFILLPLKGLHAELNVRAFSLLENLQLSDRICNDFNDLNDLLYKSIDYSKINKFIDKERERIFDLLSKQLNFK